MGFTTRLIRWPGCGAPGWVVTTVPPDQVSPSLQNSAFLWPLGPQDERAQRLLPMLMSSSAHASRCEAWLEGGTQTKADLCSLPSSAADHL